MSSLDTLTLILNTVLQLWLVSYLWQLEGAGCDCALGWRRQYIMGHIIVVTVLNLTDYLLQIIYSNTFFTNIYILFVLLCANIIYIIIVITYVMYLKSAKCICSDDMRRDVLFIVSIVQGIVIALTVAIVFWTIRQWRKIQITKQSKTDKKVTYQETIEAPEYVQKRKTMNATNWFSDHLPENNNVLKIKLSILVLACLIMVAIGLAVMMGLHRYFKPQ